MGKPATYNKYYHGGRGKFNLKDLWAFPDKKPGYMYRCDEANTSFGVDVVLNTFSEFNVWDGMCRENNIYAIGPIMVYKSSKRNGRSLNDLYMTYDGCLFFAHSSDVTMLYKNGAVFIQVSTPELSYPQSYDYTELVDYPCVGIPKEDEFKYIGYRQKTWDVEEVQQRAEFVWWRQLREATVFDLRCYAKARVFGIGCAIRASAVIFPESTEQVWLGMFRDCLVLKAVYLPSSLKKIHHYNRGTKRFKNTIFYSNSPVVEQFCKENKIGYQPCATAEEMLEKFYQATDSSISVADAVSIAFLMGDTSEKVGESGKLWSGVRLSCKDKGIATDILRERYPIVAT